MAPYFIRFGSDVAAAGAFTAPVLAWPWGTTEGQYPRTIGGLTLGIIDGAGGISVSTASGWASGDDARLAGRWRQPNSSAPRIARVDLAGLGGAGDFLIGIVCPAHGYQHARWRVKDGVAGTVRVDCAWQGEQASAWNNLAPTNFDQYLAMNSAGTGVVNLGAIDTDATTPAIPMMPVTFSTGILEFTLGGHPSGSWNSDVGFLVIERVSAPPPALPRVGFIALSGYPAAGAITPGVALSPPLVLQAVDENGNPTTDGDGDTVTLGVEYVLSNATVVSGGTAPQVGDRATYSALILNPAAIPALDPPVLTAGTPADTTSTRTVTITLTPDPDWPAGTNVQLQSRRGSEAFASVGSPTESSLDLAFPREVAAYDVEVQGIARTTVGTPISSAPSAVLTITVPALSVIPVLTTATPLRCLVTMYPSSSAPIVATAGGGTQSLTVRAQTDHVLRLQQIVAEITGTPHVPQAIRYTIEADTGVIADGAVTVPIAADDWQLPLSRALFTVDRAALVLVLTLVAQNDSETTMWFTLARGLRQ